MNIKKLLVGAAIVAIVIFGAMRIPQWLNASGNNNNTNDNQTITTSAPTVFDRLDSMDSQLNDLRNQLNSQDATLNGKLDEILTLLQNIESELNK